MIVYAVVARQTTVLAESSAAAGNFVVITRRVLAKIPPRDAMMSYKHNEHLFHFIVESNLTFLCIANEQVARRVVFGFLTDVKERFKASHGHLARTALAYGLNSKFAPVLAERMDYYSNNPDADKINKINQDLGDLKRVMEQNLDQLLERGEKIDLLVHKAEDLSQQASTFKTHGGELRSEMRWRNLKLNLAIVLVLGLVVLLLLLAICGPSLQC